MNKPQPKDNLIPVRDFKYPTRRGFNATVQYIYKLIKENKENGKALTFDYVEEDKQIWIVKKN